MAVAVDKLPHTRRLAWWGLTLGVLLCVALILRHGVGDVTAAIARVGNGFFVIVLLHGAQVVLDGMGWRAILTRARRPPVGTFVWGRWLADSVNDLLPVMQMGGNVVRARALAGTGVPRPTAGASVVVDMTLIMATQLPLTLVGLWLLVVYFDAGAVVGRVVAGAIVTAGILAGLILAQRRGLFSAGARLLERLVQPPEQLAMASSSAALDGEVHRLYRNWSALVAASAWHVAGWLAGTAETWVALYYLEHPVSVPAAIIWQSLGEVIRTAAFGVPGALGVQEGGYVVIGALLGVPPDASLALSLVLRGRELIFGVPGLLAWRSQPATAEVIRRRAAAEAE
jgi:putative membrane protein